MSNSESTSLQTHPPRWPAFAAAAVLLAEAFGVAVLVLWEGAETLTARPDSFAGAAALFVLGVVAVVWAVATLIGLVRVRPWSRGSAITWQVLQFAVGIGSFQGLYARPDVGWLLCVPAVAVVVLLMLPAATRAFAGRGA